MVLPYPAARWPLSWRRWPGWLQILGRAGVWVFELVIEPVELEGGEIAAKPISLRKAQAHEARHYWRHCR